jgi:hypothetical protein
MYPPQAAIATTVRQAYFLDILRLLVSGQLFPAVDAEAVYF